MKEIIDGIEIQIDKLKPVYSETVKEYQDIPNNSLTSPEAQKIVDSMALIDRAVNFLIQAKGCLRMYQNIDETNTKAQKNE